MKKIIGFLAVLMVLGVLSIVQFGAAQYVTKIYMDSNGDRQVVDNGGVVKVLSGGVIDLEPGGFITFQGSPLIASATNINYVSGVTPGQSTASKALVLSSTISISEVTVTNRLEIPSNLILYVSGTSVSSSGTELNYLDGSYPGSTVASTAQVVSSTKSQAEVITGTLTIPANGQASFATSALMIHGNRALYAKTNTISTTTANTISFQVDTIDADDIVFPSLKITASTSYTYIVGYTPLAGAVDILLSSAPASGGVTISVMALED